MKKMKMTTQWNEMLYGLLLLAGMANLMAFNGPILDEPPVEYMVDAFDEAEPAFEFKCAPGGKVQWRGGVAKEGYGSAQVTLPETGPAYWEFVWKFPEPKDLSDYGVFNFWYMPEGEGWHRPFIEIHKADGWFVSGANNLDSSRAGQWQRAALGRNDWRWCTKDGAYDPEPLDLRGVTAIKISAGRASGGRVFSLDSVGFSKPAPVYQGPMVSIGEYGRYLKDRPSLADNVPFRDDLPVSYELPLTVSNLPEGEQAHVSVTAVDYFGRQLFEKTFDFTGGGDTTDKIVITDDRPNHIRVRAVMSVKGKDIYEATANLGCMDAPAVEDAMPNPDSIFGTWNLAPYGEYAQRLGVKWTRIKGSRVFDAGADGQRRVLGELANWQIMEQGVFPITCMGVPHPLPALTDQAGWDKMAEDFELAVRYLAARGNRIYEVANEENAHPGGKLEQFVKQNEVFYKAAHKVQPDCEVLGGCTYNVNPEWLEALCKLGGAKWMDGVVMHGYHSPEEFREKVRQVREVMRKYGMGDKKLYITEMGFMAYPTPESEAEQARFIVRSYVYGLAEQVAVILYFDLYYRAPGHNGRDRSWNLLWFDHQPRPGFIAYAAMTRRLENAKFIKELKMPGENQKGFEFEKRGKTVLVLWDLKNRGEFTIETKPKGGVTLFNIMGQKSEIKPGADGRYSIPLGPDPVYVEYNKE